MEFLERHIGQVGRIVAVLSFGLFPIRWIEIDEFDVFPTRWFRQTVSQIVPANLVFPLDDRLAVADEITASAFPADVDRGTAAGEWIDHDRTGLRVEKQQVLQPTCFGVAEMVRSAAFGLLLPDIVNGWREVTRKCRNVSG